MPRRVVLLLVTCAPLSAGVAAPVPPAAEAELAKLARTYGTWTDPGKDCKFQLTGGELRVSLPTSDHLLDTTIDHGTGNAPRALREVDGDFTAIVRVVIPIPDQPLPMKFWPCGAGGLVAWESNKEHFAVRLSGGRVNGEREGIFAVLSQAKVHSLLLQGFRGAPTGKGFVRLKREGNKVTAGWNRDGKQWRDFKAQDVTWGAKVKVGVLAESNLGVPVEVTFDQYSLTQPKK